MASQMLQLTWKSVNRSFNTTHYAQICWHASKARKLDESVKKLLPNNKVYTITLSKQLLGIRINEAFSGKKWSSRFYRANDKLGVFYVAERPETAIKEMGYYYWLAIFEDSPFIKKPKDAVEYNVFSVQIVTDKLFDLSNPDYSDIADDCLDQTDYSAAQEFALRLRDAGGEAIRYQSVRVLEPSHNLAIFVEEVISGRHDTQAQIWNIIFQNDEMFAKHDALDKVIQIPIPQVAQQTA